MNLVSDRIINIVDTIQYKTIADIGTDHGYISITAVENKNVNKAIACDINKGPLENAKKNIMEKNLSNIIETRLGGGLSQLKEGEVETIVIAGMGGLLLCEILTEHKNIVTSSKELVLQPQSAYYQTRQTILDLGFYISTEKYLIDNNKYYIIFHCLKGSDEYTELQLLYGKNIDNKTLPIYLQFLKKNLNTTTKIISSLEENNVEEKLSQLKKEKSDLIEVLSQYEN